jgi:hypothetical protein
MQLIQAMAAASVVGVLASPIAAADLSDLPAPFQDKIAEARDACADAGGDFAIDWGAVHRVDLGGDTDPDWALDEAAFACSSAANLFCGTGGCMLHTLIDDHLTSILSLAWHVIATADGPAILVHVHPSGCDDRAPCLTISAWDAAAQSWATANANWDQ